MNILITNAYSLEQKGDTSLLVGTAGEMYEVFPGAHIEAQVMQRCRKGECYEDIPVMDSIVYIALAPDQGKVMRALRMLAVSVGSLVWAWFSAMRGKNSKLFLSQRLYIACKALYEADLVVAVAGGYIVGQPGFLSSINLVFVLLPLWIAHILQKPVIHFSQSVGPLGNTFQRFIVKKTLQRAQLIITRESVSTRFARSLGLNQRKVTQSIDAGFLFTPTEHFSLQAVFEGVLPPRPYVGITSKVHLSPRKQALYEHELAAFADWLCEEQHMTVLFIPQITSSALNEDDRIINRRVYAHMKNRSCAYLLEKNLTSRDTKALIEMLDYMVGTRFHSVIYALTGYVPSIAIEYEHKTRGIMQDLGLSDWILTMEGLTALQLSVLFTKLMTKREAYCTHLREKLPPYLNEAKSMRSRIAQAYAQWKEQ